MVKTSTSPEELIKALEEAQYEPITRIELAPGIYRFPKPLVLRGLRGLTISSDKAVFVGSIPLNLSNISPGLDLDALYLNGKKLTMTCYPNVAGEYANETALRSRSIHWSNPEGAYLLALHEHRWGGNSYRITGKDSLHPTGLAFEWIGDNNRGNKYAPDTLRVENIYEELNAPGQWYYNKNTGELFIRDSINRDDLLEGVVNHRLIELVDCTDITLEGIAFKHTARSLFREQYAPLLRGDWAAAHVGCVTIHSCNSIRINDCSFDNLGGNAVFIHRENSSINITGCTFDDIGASCIQVVGTPEAVWEPSFWERDNIPNGGTVHKTTVEFPECKGTRTNGYPRNILIQNCHMRNMGTVEKQSAGVNLSICANVRILNNTIHKSPRACININDGCFGGHEIAWNDIFDAQRETKDHGPFNSWGRDRFWSMQEYNTRGAHGAQKRPFALIDCVETTTIHHNRFHHAADAAHTWGIDLDDGSSNYKIYENLCWGMGVKLREGFDRHVYRNLIICGQMNIHCTYANAQDSIYENVIYHNSPWAFAGQGSDVAMRLRDGEYHIRGNIYPATAVLPAFFAEEGFDTDHVRIAEYHNSLPAWAQKLIAADYGSPNCKEKPPLYNVSLAETDSLQEFAWQGATITGIDDNVRSATSCSFKDGAYIKDAPEHSAAYKMGLRTHDILLEVGGKVVISAKLLSTVNIGENGGFKVFRDGTQVRVCSR